jgi:hypothetical protein
MGSRTHGQSEANPGLGALYPGHGRRPFDQDPVSQPGHGGVEASPVTGHEERPTHSPAHPRDADEGGQDCDAEYAAEDRADLDGHHGPWGDDQGGQTQLDAPSPTPGGESSHDDDDPRSWDRSGLGHDALEVMGSMRSAEKLMPLRPLSSQ